jgi:gluconolactonase
MRYVFLSALFLLLACQPKEKIAYVEALDPALASIISSETTIEVLADGFEWSEGPLWLEQENILLFSDVPKNTIYKWSEAKGLETYLTPSGFTTQEEGNVGEGSNGLLLNAKGELVLCQHGDRRVAVMQASLQTPQANFTTLVDRFDGKRFNSPNDAAYNSKGVLFFTDPPYGLASQDEDSLKEFAFNGVYSLKSDGNVQLLIDSLTRPNGIITINDSTLLVANSDKMKARWYRYTLKRDSLVAGEVFYDATANAQTEKGLPDGLKISGKGIIYATGPGGVWIFDRQGKVLGKIRTSVAAANCALDQHEKYLYVTASNYLLRIALK